MMKLIQFQPDLFSVLWTFHFDGDPDPDWQQNNTDPHAEPTPRFTHVGKLGNIFFYFY
jgi:hypothetical protein